MNAAQHRVFLRVTEGHTALRTTGEEDLHEDQARVDGNSTSTTRAAKHPSKHKTINAAKHPRMGPTRSQQQSIYMREGLTTSTATTNIS
jgi:hypothetical protein